MGSGSAFAVDEHHLVTNHHVVATDVGPELVAPSGERIRGEVIGMSPTHDVAVIETEEPLPVTVTWAAPETITAGERITAFGYPEPTLAFTVSWGQVVDVLDATTAPTALLTDAPIDHGNSGGPALRSDGTVAGVVTQMSIGGSNDHAAIVFTTAAVQPLVAGFIAEPQAVVSDCGYGPDYVPPVPGNLTLPAVLPPPAAQPTAPPVVPTAPDVPSAPTVTLPTPPTRPTSTTAPCPAGGPAVAVRSFQALPATGPGDWTYSIEAEASDLADAEIVITAVRAIVTGTTESALDQGFLEPLRLAPGTATTFSVQGAITSDTEPILTRLELRYAWGDGRLAGCPTPEAVAT